MPLTLSVLPGEYAVCQLPPGEGLPGWAMSGELWSVTRTPQELSLVCPAAAVPAGTRGTPGWAALRLHGPFDFAQTGVLVQVLDPLRGAGVGIFALSTHDTDWVLVQAEQLATTVAALRAAGLVVEDAPR